MNRKDHVAEIKQRALAYVAVGDYNGAIDSMINDLTSYRETENHPVKRLAMLRMLRGELNTYEEVTDLINGIT